MHVCEADVRIPDACIARLVPRQTRYAALLAYASSTGVLALAIRPFSNGAESALLAGSLLALCTYARAPSARGAAGLGALLALGAFARFTFALFALPLGLFLLASASARHVLAAGAAGGAAALAHVCVDTAYYARGHVVVAPLNALLYNVRGENLAQHGLHPRWLHAVLNAPLVLGVGVYVAALLGALRLRGGAAPGNLPSRGALPAVRMRERTLMGRQRGCSPCCARFSPRTL
jgi:phosphatidylinositol glycan class Z